MKITVFQSLSVNLVINAIFVAIIIVTIIIYNPCIAQYNSLLNENEEFYTINKIYNLNYENKASIYFNYKMIDLNLTSGKEQLKMTIKVGSTESIYSNYVYDRIISKISKPITLKVKNNYSVYYLIHYENNWNFYNLELMDNTYFMRYNR